LSDPFFADFRRFSGAGVGTFFLGAFDLTPVSALAITLPLPGIAFLRLAISFAIARSTPC
jgi:hypothetical protein